jgi:hypothetical protein
MAHTSADEPAALGPEMADEIAPSDHVARGNGVTGTLLIGTVPGLTPRQISISIVYEPGEDGWVQARIEGIPEVITAASSKDEARTLVLDALREYLLSIRANGDALDRELVDLSVSA